MNLLKQSSSWRAVGRVVALTIGMAIGLGWTGTEVLGLAVGAPAAVQVTTVSDDGAGSLRRALNDAAAGATITFAPALSGRAIQLTSGPLRTDRAVTIDASALSAGLRLDGNRAGRILLVGSNAVATLQGVTLTNGFLISSNNLTWGAAVDNRGILILHRCEVAGNTLEGVQLNQSFGGAIVNFGTLTVRESSLSGNTVRAAATGGAGWGGAIASFGTLTIERSTLSGNSARAGGADFDRAYGGAVMSAGTLVVNQSTFAGNAAVAGPGRSGWAYGGAIYSSAARGMSLNQSTVSGNLAQPGSGADSHARGGGVDGRFLFVYNSIVAGNTAPEGPNLGLNSHTELGTNVLSGDPVLSPLGFYGGPTQTMPPRAGSPAIDAASDGATNDFAFDQRGLPRRVGAHVDVGATEVDLQVAAAPSGVDLPPRVLAAISSNLTLSVSPGGTAPFRFQWYFNKKAIASGTNAALVLTNVQVKNAGSYQVRVANNYGAVTSRVSQVQALVAPSIRVQPKPANILAGRKLSLSVVASGAAPLSYQWRRNGVPLSGATNATYTVTSAMPAEAGFYTVLVRNAVGETTSASAAVVVPPLQIMLHPKPLTVVAGSAAKFTAKALSTFPLSYQWQQNGNPIPGATNASLTILGAQPVHRGEYTVVMTNRAGSLSSTGAVLGVTVIPVKITAQPRTVTVRVGDRATMTVAATGTVPFSYQWRFGGNAIAGATNSSLVLTNVQLDQAGLYSVVVRNVESLAISSNATLVVRTAPARQNLEAEAGAGSRPRLGVSRAADGRTILEIVAPKDAEVVVESSTDLKRWEAMGTVTGGGDAVPVTVVDDRSGAGAPARFYRLRLEH